MRTTIIAVCALLVASVNASASTGDEQAIRLLDQEYVKAFNAKDLNGVMASFSDDAIYNMEDGLTLRGKEDIRRVLEEQFNNSSNSELELKVYNIEFAPDRQRATERGVSIVTTDGIEEPASYVAEFSKHGDQWKVSRVTEQAQAKSTEHLNKLSWMIGDWIDQSEDVSVRTKSEWALDRAFIIRRFAVSVPARREMKGIEYIGWDPVRSEIHSWYFDSDGGYGGGRWRNEGGRWIEEATGITPLGEIVTSTHILTPKDSNTFTWRSINRQVGGEKQPDIEEYTIKRLSKNESSDVTRGQL